MKKHFAFIAVYSLLFLSNINLWAQEHSEIKGKINAANGNPIENITIKLKNQNIITTSNHLGEYLLQKVKSGNYTIKISGIGYITQEKKIVITENDHLYLNFILEEHLEQLDEVVIQENKSKFTRTESAQVSRMPLKNIENAQVYTTITNEILKEQVVTNIDDALKNAPGITKLWESTGRGGDGAGYFSLRGFAVQPTMINGLPGLTNGGLDPANIERIEVIKGPSGTLFGSSLISYGGLINITTKKTYHGFGGELSYITGSYGLNRVVADVNTPLNKENTINFRLNTAYHTEDSFQDAGFRKSFFIAPSLSYEVNDKLSFLFNTEIMTAENTNPIMLFLDRSAPLRVINSNELGYNNKRSYTSNDLTLKTPTFNLQGQMNYKLSSEWNSQTVLSRSSSKSNGIYSYLYESTHSNNYKDLKEGVVFARYINHQNSSTLTTDIQQNFIGDFKIGNLRNRMVVGADYFNRTIINNGSGYVGNGAIYIGNASVQNVNETVFGITNPTKYIPSTVFDNGNLSLPASNALLANAPISNIKTNENVYSAYISNVLNFTPALSTMISLRIDHFDNKGDITTKDDNFNQTAVSPKFGLVYQPILNKVALFANYMNGFMNIAPSEILTNGAPSIKTFRPEQANQIEIGTKLNLINDKLIASFSYYNIKVSDKTIRVDIDANNYYFLQDGKSTSKGFETEIVANPIKDLNIIAGYSYNDSHLTKSDATDFVGRRPESAGPKNLINLWASYKFNKGTLNGFGLGFGGNYASENLVMNRNLAGTFTLPSYTVINSSIFYSTKNYILTLKLDNITNKEYYTGWATVNPQRPRSINANFSYKF